MVTLLSRLFINDAKAYREPEVRRAYGTLCSVMGIVLNLGLFAGKLLAGLFSGSVAILADAFNNLSDGGSSLITLAGFWASGRKPDREHPFGHGRIEYVAGFSVSLCIILMGVEFIRSSVEKIITPGRVGVEGASFLILLLSVAVKGYMFSYNYLLGKKLDSGAMRATALDSLGDMLSTGVVILSMGIAYFWNVNADGWCGLVVACFILVGGVQAARDTISPLLGSKPRPEFIHDIHAIVMRHEKVVGIHNVVVHDYGPGRVMISLHVEMPGGEDIYRLHDIVEEIERDLDEHLHCVSVIHMDPVDVCDERVQALRGEVEREVSRIHSGLSIHDFRVIWGDSAASLVFDVVIPPEHSDSQEEILEEIRERVSRSHPDCRCIIKVDSEYI